LSVCSGFLTGQVETCQEWVLWLVLWLLAVASTGALLFDHPIGRCMYDSV